MKAQLFVLILILGLVSIVNAQPGRDVTWTQVESALHPFAYAGSGVLGNYFYCFGGDAFTPYAQAFNNTTELWYESTLPLYGWIYCGSATTDSAIYLIGGNAYGGSVGAEVQKFRPNGSGPTGTWTQMQAYPFAAWGIAAAWDGGSYIYAAGGMQPAMHNEAYKYDIANNTWTQIASMPVATAYGAGAFVQDRFYVVGGGYTSNMLFEYNPTNNSWTSKTGPPTAVQLAHASTTFNDSLVFVIGGGSFGLGSNAVQVYNPLTDTWTLEAPLLQSVSCNCARIVAPDKVISAGGSVSGGLTTASYRGTGFPSGSPTSYLSATLVPFVQPIQIPASGGTFDYYLFVDNSATFSQEVEIWTKVIAPGGGIFGPLLGPATVNMDPGTRGWLRHQNVPGRWPSGLYTYIAYVGDYPTGNIWATDSLQFAKLATGDGPRVGDWACTGEEIAPDVGAYGVRSSGSWATPTMEVLPNPFNPTTVLSYRLPVASRVSLRIYDTAGRLVMELVNSWRDAGEHQITFDGSGLPSGIYFAKLRAGDYSQVQKLVLMK